MSSVPPPLESLSATELKAVKANLITEHFRWAPETFAKGGMDLANTTMYAATRIVDESLQQLSVAPSEGDERPFTLPEEDIQKGIYRLETLLEHGIDDAFDRFELFVLRNTFTVPTELVPFIALSHQDHIDVELKGKDLDAIREYEEQLRLYEQELDKERQLACVEELMRRKLEQTQERAQEIGYMGSAGEPLSARAQGLLPQLRLLQERLVKLSDTAAPPTQGPAPTEGDPWTTRSAFVNWAATSKINSLPAAPTPGQTGASEDAAISQIHDKMGKTGKQEDAASLMDKL